MISPITTANIFSKLGSNSSLLPIAAKDASHSLGITTSSYIAGDKIEGKDRLIDEFGTQAIWLGGIPFYKKVIDCTIYKMAGHNPDLDIRVMKDEKIYKKAIEHAPTEEIAKSIEKAALNIKTFKGLSLTKFVASTVLTLGSYAALTSFRHKQTEKAIIKEIEQEEKITKKENFNQQFLKTKNKKFLKENKKSNPAFGMKIPAGVSEFMFNPVKNMMLVDGGITAERLKDSRNPQDFMGYVIKEGSFWAFMYFVGPEIQKHFEKISDKKNNKSIDLDARVLQDEEFQKSLVEKAEGSNLTKMEESIKDFAKNKTDEEIYDFVCSSKNKDNLIVKMAKKSGIIEEYKKTGKIDTQKFIDLQEIKGINLKIEKLKKQMESATESADDFLKKVVSLKKGSILKNLGACMGVLGLVVPGIMLAARFLDKDNKGFQVKNQIKEKMMKRVDG